MDSYASCSCCARPGSYLWPHYMCRGCDAAWDRAEAEMEARHKTERSSLFDSLKEARTAARIAANDNEPCDWDATLPKPYVLSPIGGE
jgi:hypothetical protein